MASQPETVNDIVLYELRNVHADKDITIRMLDGADFSIWGEVFVNGDPVSGGGTFPIATQAEAEAGVDNTKVMTPLRVKQAITYQVPLSLYLPLTGGSISGSLTVVGATNLRDTYFRQWNGAATGAKTNMYQDGSQFYFNGSTDSVAFTNFVFEQPIIIINDTNNLQLKGVSQVEIDFMSDSDVWWGTLYGTTAGLKYYVSGTGRTHIFDINGTTKLTVANTVITATIDIVVPDEVYGTGWNGSLEVPTKNAVYDKIESLVLGAGGVTSVNTKTGVVTLNQDEITDGTTYKQYSGTEKTKLAGIATGATVNSSDATLLARANHTGSQAISTITNLQTTLDGKADDADVTVRALDSAVVHNTGSETVAGIKTFSSDPLIPDEAYSSSWNGVLEPPTKNAIYDKIETLGGGATDAYLLDRSNHTGMQIIATITNLQNTLDAKQPIDTDLTTIAGLTATTDNIIQSTGSAWASRTPTQVKTALALDNVTNTTDANKPVSTAQQTALDLKVNKAQTINAQTGTTYTLVLTDDSKLVTLSNAAAIALTVPTNASVAFPVGTHIDLAQLGAGQVTVAGSGGVTVNATPTLKFRAQYSGASLVKYATDTWLLVGDLATT